MAQRLIRLYFHLHRIMCPHCEVVIEYNTLTETLPGSEKTCAKCGAGFAIQKGVGRKLKKRAVLNLAHAGSEC